MKHLHEYREAGKVLDLVQSINSRATKRWRIMDVCGGQTHNLLKYGIEDALAGTVELIHGPGCPVCVTPAEVIDQAQLLSQQSEVVLMTFGDMLRVPGTTRSLNDVKACGGQIRTVYSPLDAVNYAQTHPEQNIIFFAVGFETTAPATALALLQADRLQLNNFFLLTCHVRVLPAMRLVMQQSGSAIDGFLAAGHVCTITGFRDYEQLASDFSVPIVITGFEPLDLLAGIEACLNLLEEGRTEVLNRYPRSAQPSGNQPAKTILETVYEVTDQHWRGMGVIPASGLSLKSKWSRFDARSLLSADRNHCVSAPSECLSHEILQGRLKPPECPAFGTRCQPQHPLGAPMVSSEGACAAYYQYHRSESATSPSAT